MASSDDNMLAVESSRDSITINNQHNVHLLADTTCRHAFKSLSLSFRQLCVMATVFLIVMGILSRSYLESPLKVIMDQTLDSMRMESIPKYHNIIHVAASDLSLKMFEDAVKLSTRESTQEAESSIRKEMQYAPPLLEENAIGTDEQHIKDGLLVPPVGQYEIQGGEEMSIRDIEIQNAEEISPNPVAVQLQQQVEEINLDDQSTRNPAILKVSPQEEEKRIEVLPEELLQDGTLSTNAEEKELVHLNGAQNTSPVETNLQPVDSSATKANLNSSTGKCDLAVGKWVHDPAGPLYRSDECSILSQAQNCQNNGRPDHGYESYRWEPDHCSLPRFDPIAFLEMMRGKTVAFVGDSLARNQMESLMCILLQAANARSKGGKGIHKWYFPSHNFTVIRMWSSWLVRPGGDFPPSMAPDGVTKLNLTELDDYAEHLPSFDVTVLSSGHWWLRNTAYFINGEMLGGMGFRWLPEYGEMKVNHSRAYDIAWNTTLQKVGSYPGYKGLTIVRTYTPDHYHGGSWNTGGSCTGETKPYQEPPSNLFNEMMRDQQVKIFEFHTQSAPGRIMPNGSKLRLLDVYTVLSYRGDGHPGPYENTDPLKQTTRNSKGRPPPQDCLHWCMPGPVDTMNELLFHLLMEEMQ